MKKFAKTIKMTDFISGQVKPTFGRNSRISSFFGGCLSIIIVVLALLGFVFFGMDLVKKTNPKSSVSQESMENSSVLLKDYPISFFTRYGDKINHNDPRLKRALKFSGWFNRWYVEDEQPKWYGFEVPVRPCKIEDMTERLKIELKETINTVPFYNCFDFEAASVPKTEKLELLNYYKSRNSASFSIFVELCDEKADPGCSDYFIKTLGQIQISVNLLDEFVDVQNFLAPISVNYLSTQTTISPNSSLAQIFTVKINVLITDDGWILPNKSTKEYLSVGEKEFQIIPLSANSRTLYRGSFQTPKLKVSTTRSYLTIQELLANVGGLIKGLMTIAVIITDKYSSYILMHKVKNTFLPFSEIILKRKSIKMQQNFIVPKQNESNTELKNKNELKFEVKSKITIINMPETKHSKNFKGFVSYIWEKVACKKEQENFDDYLDFLDFKAVFSEIISIKEELAKSTLNASEKID